MLYFENPNQKSVIMDYWLSVYNYKLTKRLDTTNNNQHIKKRYNNRKDKKDSNTKQHCNLKNFSNNTSSIANIHLESMQSNHRCKNRINPYRIVSIECIAFNSSPEKERYHSQIEEKRYHLWTGEKRYHSRRLNIENRKRRFK